MSYNLIHEGINKINTFTSISAFLIKYNHRTHPNEFTCYNLNFSSTELLKNSIKDMCNTYLNKVQAFDKKVIEYTGFNPKNTVDKIPIDDPLVNDCWNELIQRIANSDDSTPLKETKANAFIFVGTYNDAETNLPQNMYFLTRKNPVLSFKNRANIFASKSNTICEAKEPLIQFGKCFDAIIYKNTIYMINSNCETIFNMEYSHTKICRKSLDLLNDSKIIEDIETFRQYAISGQTPKKFITYDNSIVENLKDDTWKIKVSTDLKIPLNPITKKFDLSLDIHAKNFTLLVCGKTKLDMFNNKPCEVPTSTPLNLS
ncbi:Kiwa anti-phage protein KwaB-like domain-containing protein [Clostridium butyricum]|jgi:hypothetical protein